MTKIRKANMSEIRPSRSTRLVIGPTTTSTRLTVGPTTIRERDVPATTPPWWRRGKLAKWIEVQVWRLRGWVA